MQTQLLEKIELIKTQEDFVSIDDILDNHSKLLKNDYDTNNKTLELINIMGGMDIVLRNYLLNNNINKSLNNNQLNKINNILISINESAKTNNNNPNNVDLDSVILSVSTSNTWLHSLFNSSNASKIINLLFSRLIALLLFLVASLIVIIIFLDLRDSIQTLLGNILFFPFILYFIFTMLSLNKKITKIILKSFDLWIKLFYFTRTFICIFLYSHVNNVNPMAYEMQVAMYGLGLFVIFIYSSIDGLQISNKYKRFITVLIAICWLIVTIYWTYTSIFELSDKYFFNTILFDRKFSIDLASYIANGVRIVTIFFWKQAFKSLYYKDKANEIKANVKIKWKQ